MFIKSGHTCTVLVFPVLFIPVWKHSGKNRKINLTEKFAILQYLKTNLMHKKNIFRVRQLPMPKLQLPKGNIFVCNQYAIRPVIWGLCILLTTNIRKNRFMQQLHAMYYQVNVSCCDRSPEESIWMPKTVLVLSYSYIYLHFHVTYIPLNGWN